MSTMNARQKREGSASAVPHAPQLAIRRATADDIADVCGIYQELFDFEERSGSHSNWKRGVYPNEQAARSGLESATLLVAQNASAAGGKPTLVASMILNRSQPAEYRNIAWERTADAGEPLVIHTLCVAPSCAGQGIGKAMVAFAQQQAVAQGVNAVRLDTYADNQPAIRLYERCGFSLCGSGIMNVAGAITEEQVYLEWHAAEASSATN